MKKVLILALSLIFAFLLVACSNPYDSPLAHGDSSNSTNIYFDVLRFTKHQTTTPQLMEEADVLNLIGNPDEIKEWKMENKRSQSYAYFPMKAYIYNNGINPKTGTEDFREFDFASGKLVRITIQETIPYKNKKDFFRLFNLKKFPGSFIIEDTAKTFRYGDVKISDFWVWNYDDKNIKGVTFTLIDGVFNDY